MNIGKKIKEIKKSNTMEFVNHNLEKIKNINLALVYFLRLTLVIAIIGSIINQRWTVLFVTTLILLLTMAHGLFEKKYNISLPLEFELIIIIFLYASLFLGELHGYYTKFWWWDIALHTSSGIALGFIGFIILYILYHKNLITAKPFWIVLFSFCFAVAIGAVWEIFEFVMDSLFGFNMQKSGLIDTMWDLIVDSIGALFTSLVGYYYIKGKKIPLFNRMLYKFFKENPQLYKKSRKII